MFQDVTGVVGQTAYLTCRVFDRTNKTVSASLFNILIFFICFVQGKAKRIRNIGHQTSISQQIAKHTLFLKCISDLILFSFSDIMDPSFRPSHTDSGAIYLHSRFKNPELKIYFLYFHFSILQIVAISPYTIPLQMNGYSRLITTPKQT